MFAGRKETAARIADLIYAIRYICVKGSAHETCQTSTMRLCCVYL